MTKRKYKAPNPRTEASIRRRIQAVVDDARRSGYVVTVDVGKLPPRRLAVTQSALYLRPLDGSDMHCCACCGRPYEQRTHSKHLPNYVPLSWCTGCRQELVESGGDEPSVRAKFAHARAGMGQLIRLSVARVRRTIESWGPAYRARLREELERHQIAVAEVAAKKGELNNVQKQPTTERDIA